MDSFAFDFYLATSNDLAKLAADAVLAELETSPKPGLVDPTNSGAHRDMDFELFLKGAGVLADFFPRVLELAYTRRQLSDPYGREEFQSLRTLAKMWEKRLFGMTGGVNTHKGMLFAFSLVLYALGKELYHQRRIPNLQELSQAIASLGRHSLADLQTGREESGHGYQLFQTYGISGARQQAASGYKTVFEVGLPAMIFAYDLGFTPNGAQIWTLLKLSASLSDTNLYHRLGLDLTRQIQAELAADLLRFEQDFQSRRDSVSRVRTRGRLAWAWESELVKYAGYLDRHYIDLGASPGGAADCLALTIFFYQVKQWLKDQGQAGFNLSRLTSSPKIEFKV